jgi:hypothetical protein
MTTHETEMSEFGVVPNPHRKEQSTPTYTVCGHVSAYKVWECPRNVSVLYAAHGLFVRGKCLFCVGYNAKQQTKSAGLDVSAYSPRTLLFPSN